MLYPSLLAAWALMSPGIPQENLSRADFAQARYKSVVDGQERLLLHVKLTELDPQKTSPMYDWKFNWIVSGMGRPGNASQFSQRVRVFSQERTEIEDTSYAVARMAMRLWDYNFQYLGLEHHDRYQKTVDIYLAKDGKAGGEQRIVADPEMKDNFGRTMQVNVIHIYQMPTFTKGIDRAREIAHEYGHATLPAIGGYSGLESWANGDVGERIYLQWLYRDMEAGTIGWLDTVGATKEDIAAYLSQKVDPLVTQIGVNGVREQTLNGDDRGAFMEYVALVCYAEAVLPREAFQRFVLLTGDGHGKQAYAELAYAANELDEWNVRIPRGLVGKEIWLPVGQNSISKGQVTARRGTWAKVKPADGAITIRARR
ncbi:MAG: hypothetical protein KF812_10540, partial [Fimbriimonadaceae bacterium]|nr:hypothetical protein [Fimbriimonadaceae bacterium]